MGHDIARNPSGGTVVWLGGCALAVGTWFAYRRDLQRGRPLTPNKRRNTALLGAAFALRLEAAQGLIDRISCTPNLGLLAGVAVTPLSVGSFLLIYDDMMNAPISRRRWHRVYPLVVMAGLTACWGPGVPHDRRLPWKFRGVSLDGGNRWRAVFALLSVASIAAQSIDGVIASQRIVLNSYATGRDRGLCLRSLLFSVSWGSTALLTLGNSVPPIARLISPRIDLEMPPPVQYGLLLAALAGQTLGAIAPRWALGQAGGPARTAMERRIERLLRAIFVMSCYQDVRRLAGALREVVPQRPAWVRYEQTRLRYIHRLGELEVLLQTFKGTINDARLALVGYVEVDRLTHSDVGAPERAAWALVNAIDNFWPDRVSDTASDPANPLSDAASFNDDRFIKAVSRAYHRQRHQLVAPVGAGR